MRKSKKSLLDKENKLLMLEIKSNDL